MNTTQTAPPTYIKHHARLTDVQTDGTKDKKLCTFLTKSGETYHKVLMQAGYSIDDVLENLHVPNKDWDNLEKAVGIYCQIVIQDGMLRFINEIDQKTGRVIFKPKVKMTPEQLAAINPPPQPELSVEESDKIFSEIVAKLENPPEPKVPTSRCTELFEALEGQDQLAICKIMARMAGVK